MYARSFGKLSLILGLLTLAADARAQSNDILSQSEFGHAVAVSGENAFVSEPANRRIAGRVYRFAKDPGSGHWIAAETIESPAEELGDLFGSAVASSGGMLAVTALGGREPGIHTFRNNDAGSWEHEGVIRASDYDLDGQLGASLALSAETLYSTLTSRSGATTVEVFGYEALDRTWQHTGSLNLEVSVLWNAPTPIAIDNETLLVGDSGSEAGRVLVYSRQDDHWSLADTIPSPAQSDTISTLFGVALSASAGRLMVGAVDDDGKGLVYSFAGPGRYTPEDSLSEPTVEEDAQFGAAVAFSDGVVVVGAKGDLFGYGSAFIFERQGTGDPWSLADNVRAPIATGYESIVGSTLKCEDGEAAGFDCHNVDIISFLTNDDLGLEPRSQTNDVWGWTDPESGKEYAIVCSFGATTFIDISDPENPVVLGNLPRTAGSRPNWWRDAKVYRHYAYIVADNVGEHGLQIFDLTQLREVEDPPVVFEATAHYDSFDSAHNIIINEDTGFAYVVGINGGGETCGGGLHILDLSNPLEPKFVGCFVHPGTNAGQEGATHDAQCVTYHGPDERFTGREICIASNADAISIADFTDKENIIPIVAARYPNSSYTHQGWLTEDHRYFYQNDETDELNGLTDGTRTMIWDLAELDDPVLVNMHVSENKATDHNYFIKGHYLYQSNYVSGLRVLDISDVENPVEVGYFDTVPWGDDIPGFGGSWSNYPFFESGVIVVTSGEEGVFFLKRSEVAP